MSGAGPFSVMCQGVWQSWQPEVFTMYLPRATGSFAAGACGESAARTNEAATTRANKTSIFSDFTTNSSLSTWCVRTRMRAAEGFLSSAR